MRQVLAAHVPISRVDDKQAGKQFDRPMDKQVDKHGASNILRCFQVIGKR